MNIELTGLTERMLQALCVRLSTTPQEILAIAVSEYMGKRGLAHLVHGDAQPKVRKLTNGIHALLIERAFRPWRQQLTYQLRLAEVDGDLRFNVRLGQDSLAALLDAAGYAGRQAPQVFEDLEGQRVKVVFRGGKPSRFPADDGPSLLVEEPAGLWGDDPLEEPAAKTPAPALPVMAVIVGGSQGPDSISLMLEVDGVPKQVEMPATKLSALLDATIGTDGVIDSLGDLKGYTVAVQGDQVVLEEQPG